MSVYQSQERLTKKKKRVLKQDGVLDTNNQISNGFAISKTIAPMTDNQGIAFDAWDEGANLMLHGIAGTGKIFLALYFALKEMMTKGSYHNKVYIIHSIVPTHDMDPGSQKEKMRVYEGPYYDIAMKLFNRGDACEILKHRNVVEFISTMDYFN